MTEFIRTLFLSVAVVIGAGPARAAVADTAAVHRDAVADSAAAELHSPLRSDYRFNVKQIITPAALFAAGVAGVYAFDGFKHSVRHRFSGASCGHSTKVDNYLQYVPVGVYLPLGFIPGMPHRSDFRERLMAGATAYISMAVLTNVFKHIFREPRPDSGARNSFPSGHSATVFTGAELMRIEYGNYVGIAGYAVAVTVGALRIYNDRHWINDILGGAAIGILSARIGYWLVPLERRLFRMDKKQNIAVLPAAGTDYAGLSLAMTF